MQIVLLFLTLVLAKTLVTATHSDACVMKIMSNGVTMPSVGFGTAAMRGQTTVDTVMTAIDAGFRHFDGAEAKEWYDDEALGQAIQKSISKFSITRNELFIATKLHPRNFGATSTRDAIANMLKELQVDYIDLVILHFPSCHSGIPSCVGAKVEGSWRDAWLVLESFYEKGVVRSIGVSNFDLRLLKQLWDFAQVKPHVIQNWFDPFHQDEAVMKFCEEHGIVYVAYSTLGGQWSHRQGVNRNLVQTSEVLKELATKYDKTITDIVLSWAIQRGIVVLPRSTNPEHILHNAELVYWDAAKEPLLTQEDIEIINQLDGSFDLHASCSEWASQGECLKNPDYMLTSCALSCKRVVS